MDGQATGSGALEIASILADYVPKADYENALLALEEITGERDQYKSQFEGVEPKIKEYETRHRQRAARDAYEKAAKTLKVDEKFREHVFKLAEIPADSDEPDAAAVEKHLAAWLKNNGQFVAAEQTENPPAPSRIPEGEGHSRGQSAPPPRGQYQVSRSQLNDAIWMRDHQSEVAAATRAGVLALID